MSKRLYRAAYIAALTSFFLMTGCGGGMVSSPVASAGSPVTTATNGSATATNPVDVNTPVTVPVMTPGSASPSAVVPPPKATTTEPPTPVAGNAPLPVPGTDGTAINLSQPFDLDGFKYCGKQGDTLNLVKPTHVAFGLKSLKRFVYMFNQTGKFYAVAETFGNDPVDWLYKDVFCKEVTADNNDALVVGAAMTKIKLHLEGTTVMSAAELDVQSERIKQTRYAAAANKQNLVQAFALLATYEKIKGGPLFANATTKGGFQNEFGNPDGKDIDRVVLSIQQSVFDSAYTPANFATYKDILTGKKFNSADWFPGKVKVPADPDKIYSVRINATMAKDEDRPTAFSRGSARRPTGYYLAAGDTAKITVPAAMAKANPSYVIQVGANVHDKYVKSIIARPYRVTNNFPIVSEVTEIANPNGGGIYIDVPYLANVGSDVTIKIQNAVPAPFFSATAINNVTLQQWKDVQRKNPAPWADFMTDKFMMTLPTSWIYNYDDPVTLMKDWDDRMDVVSDLLGRNRVRNNQILYMIVDTSLSSNAYGIGYPSCNNGYYNPGESTDGNRKDWFLTPGKDFWQTEFHELGHAQLFSNFPGEGEAAINVLSVAVSNKLYKVDIDIGLGKSSNGTNYLSREIAAVNWMVTSNFRDGKPMDTSNTPKDEVRYAQRGYAKYVEIAALFGWDKLEKFYFEENRVYLKQAADAGQGLSDVDSRILRMSLAAGVDLTPLIHFWGVQPGNLSALTAAMTAANLKPSAAIYDRLKLYQTLIPMDNAAFQIHAGKFFNKPASQIYGTDYVWGEGWYYYWLSRYTPAEGQAAQTSMNNIFAKYFPKGKPS